jgi:single-strand DNA-binding protein
MNSVNLIGRLTKDPELKKFKNDKSAVTFTLAVNRNKEKTDFIRCTAWNKTAELVKKFTQKGTQIGVSGAILTDSYEKDGRTVYTTEVNVNSVTLLGQNSTASTPDDDSLPF